MNHLEIYAKSNKGSMIIKKKICNVNLLTRKEQYVHWMAVSYKMERVKVAKNLSFKMRLAATAAVSNANATSKRWV